MLELNVKFQEEYKRLDSICKDIFSSTEGVSEYIKAMEASSFAGRTAVSTWNNDYKQLKHVRWIRNKLAHEEGTLYSDLCKNEDICFVISFREKILMQRDPLAILHRTKSKNASNQNRTQTTTQNNSTQQKESAGCYIATCVYGSYDCPQVWTLRRYRDNTLGSTWYGRLFIRFYYATSPTIVKWFGKTKWFKKLWKRKLDRMVEKLQAKGVDATPYNDKKW